MLLRDERQNGVVEVRVYDNQLRLGHAHKETCGARPRETLVKRAFAPSGGMRLRPRQPFIPASSAPPETSREERQSYCEREKTDLSMALYGFKQPSGQTTTPSSLR